MKQNLHPAAHIFRLALLTIATAAHANSSGGGQIRSSCLIGGYQTFDEPQLVYGNGDIVIGESRWIEKNEESRLTSSKGFFRIFDTKIKALGSLTPWPDSSLLSITAGASSGASAYLGGLGGLSMSSDLKNWNPVPQFAGKNVSKILADDDSLWIGLDDEIIRIRGDQVIKRYPHSEGRVVGLGRLDDRLLFGTVKKTSPPPGTCEPYFVSDGLDVLNIPSGKITELAATGKKPEEAPIQISSSAPNSEATVIFSDGFRSDTSYVWDSKTNLLKRSASQLSPSFTHRWLQENSSHQNAASDLMDLSEKLYEQENFLRYFQFWDDVLRWLKENKEFSRLKRMYVAAETQNKQHMIQVLGGDEDAFTMELLTLAVDRHDYFREELARIVERHKSEEYQGLLIRILREGASIEPESIGKNISVPFPCASCEAADGLLRVQGEDIIPKIEETIAQPTTRPVIKESLEHRLNTWVQNRTRRIYHPPWKTQAVFLKSLDDPSAKVRFDTIRELGTRPDAVPLNKLIAIMRGGGNYGAEAVSVIGQVNGPAASAALLEAVTSTSAPVRIRAMYEVGRRREPHAYEILIGGLNDKEINVRMAAIGGLGGLKDSRAIPFFLELIQGGGYEAAYAAKVLGFMDDQRAIPALLSTLRASNPDVRSGSAEALGRLHAKVAVSPLIEALNDGNWSVRRESVKALWMIGDPSAIEPLRRMHDSNRAVQNEVEVALKRLQ